MDKYSSQGRENLEILDGADNFTDWMYGEIKPFLRGNILEIGSGFGTYSKKIIRDFPKSNIILSDVDDHYVGALKKKFGGRVSVLKINFEREEDFGNIGAPLDSVFALNVLEHVKDDVRALENIYRKLNPGGNLVILVPAHKFLFNRIDQEVNHYRRYNKKDLSDTISKTGFRVKRMFYFNFLSIFGWYWVGGVLKRNTVGGKSVALFDKLVPFLKFFEKYILRKSLGISLIAVLEK